MKRVRNLFFPLCVERACEIVLCLRKPSVEVLRYGFEDVFYSDRYIAVLRDGNWSPRTVHEWQVDQEFLRVGPRRRLIHAIRAR